MMFEGWLSDDGCEATLIPANHKVEHPESYKLCTVDQLLVFVYYVSDSVEDPKAWNQAKDAWEEWRSGHSLKG